MEAAHIKESEKIKGEIGITERGQQGNNNFPERVASSSKTSFDKEKFARHLISVLPLL